MEISDIHVNAYRSLKNLRLIIAKLEEKGLFNVLFEGKRNVERIALQIKEDKVSTYKLVPMFVMW